jgi:hypothetical protein
MAYNVSVWGSYLIQGSSLIYPRVIAFNIGKTRLLFLNSPHLASKDEYDILQAWLMFIRRF